MIWYLFFLTVAPMAGVQQYPVTGIHKLATYDSSAKCEWHRTALLTEFARNKNAGLGLVCIQSDK